MHSYMLINHNQEKDFPEQQAIFELGNLQAEQIQKRVSRSFFTIVEKYSAMLNKGIPAVKTK